MAVKLPDSCPRGLAPTECRPLSQILADGELPQGGRGFLCCGHLAAALRSVEQDRFRFCFCGPHADSIFDHDERDIIDTGAVLTGGLSADVNRQVSGWPQDFWNMTAEEAGEVGGEVGGET